MKTHFFFFTKISNQRFFYKLVLAVILVLLGISHVSAQGNDSTPPEINEFSFTPLIINTTNTSQTVTVTIRAIDAVKGVGLISVRFKSLTGSQSQVVFIEMDSRHRISGDSKDGVYRTAVIFPQYSKAGTWQVYEIEVYSATDNWRKTFSVSDLIARGFVTELQVISDNEDIIPPEILDFRIPISNIDMFTGSGNSNVIVRARDAKVGVRSIYIAFHLPNLTAYYYPMLLESNKRVSGDANDGIYRSVTEFSRYSIPGA